MDHARQQGFSVVPTPRFTVGRDHHGWWVVHDREDRVGGLFSTEAAALHFAEAECAHQPGAVCRAGSGCLVELGAFTADILPVPQRRVA